MFLLQSSNDLWWGLSRIDSSTRGGGGCYLLFHHGLFWDKVLEVVPTLRRLEKRDPPIFSDSKQELKSVCYAAIKCFFLAQWLRFGIEQLISRDAVIEGSTFTMSSLFVSCTVHKYSSKVVNEMPESRPRDFSYFAIFLRLTYETIFICESRLIHCLQSCSAEYSSWTNYKF